MSFLKINNPEVTPFPNDSNEISDIILAAESTLFDDDYFGNWIENIQCSNKGKKISVLLIDFTEEATKQTKDRLSWMDLNGIKYLFIHDKADKDVTYIKALTDNIFIDDLGLPGHFSYLNAADFFCVTQRENEDGKIIRNVYVSWRFFCDELVSFMKENHGATAVTELSDEYLIPAGNLIVVGNNVFIGRSFLTDSIKNEDEDKVRTLLKEKYDLPDYMSIHFVGPKKYTHNKSLLPILYHLDLIMTCTGVDSEGIYQFYIPFVPSDDTLAVTDENASIELVRRELDEFYIAFKTLLNKIYSQKYRIVRVPAYMADDGGSIYSPVNGVVDSIYGHTKYYFPYVELDGRGIHNFRTIALYQDIALSIFRSCVGNDQVIKMKLSNGYITVNGSQSLHCMMAVVGRH